MPATVFASCLGAFRLSRGGDDAWRYDSAVPDPEDLYSSRGTRFFHAAAGGGVDCCQWLKASPR
jgi:hypothetical protein